MFKKFPWADCYKAGAGHGHPHPGSVIIYLEIFFKQFINNK